MVWSGGSVTASVTASQGTAVAQAVGDITDTVSAGQHAGAVTLGNFDGSVTAGSDAWLLSEGSINGSLSALKDGLVYASGSVTGGFSAGRDIGVISYGAITAGVSAGRDVVFVRAVGNLDGVISAGHDIGGPWVDPDGLGAVSSYSAIGSNPSISTTIIAGHDIASVVAVGSINGSIIATDSLYAIRSGNAITATISASNTVPISAFDTLLANLSPPPTPGSSSASLEC